jgi:hypothetical protein
MPASRRHATKTRPGVAALATAGIEILPELVFPEPARQGTSLAKLLRPAPEHFFPGVAHGLRIAQAQAARNADSLMVPWSEWLTAAASNVPLVKFAYYGNPDHKTGALNHSATLPTVENAKLFDVRSRTDGLYYRFATQRHLSAVYGGPKHPVIRVGGVTLHIRHQVAVDFHRDRDAGTPKALLDDLRMHVRGQHVTCVAVPQTSLAIAAAIFESLRIGLADVDRLEF